MEIWTDGTISPERSMSTASKILIDHLRYIAGSPKKRWSLAPRRNDRQPPDE
jgi:DNA-directed RNA polymerase subunit alpha